MKTWTEAIGQEKQQSYFLNIIQQVEQAKKSGKTVYPPHDEIFTAFRLTEFDQVKVVILGQDPYHGPNQAHGLAFSVKPGIAPPPSLWPGENRHLDNTSSALQLITEYIA